MEHWGEQFLHQKDSKLSTSKQVELAARAGADPSEKIADWIKVLERTHLGHRDNKAVLERIKSYYQRRFVIIEKDIPQSYWNSNAEKAIREGRGGDLAESGVRIEKFTNKSGVERTNYYFPEWIKELNAEVIISDQSNSLDRWLDYFADPTSDYFPVWFKYWAFTSMTGLSMYDKEKHSFSRRTKGTVAPFPDLNQQALGEVMNIMQKKYGSDYFEIQGQIDETGRQLSDLAEYERKTNFLSTGKDWQGRELSARDIKRIQESLKEPEITDRKKLEDRLTELEKQQDFLLKINKVPQEFRGKPAEEDFGSLYAYAIEKLNPIGEEEKRITQGEWVKYPRGSDHRPLVNSLQGYATGWCTAGEGVAEKQLKGGDFYVYYSEDQKGMAKIPRVAIRMEGSSIGEVRGIEADQNLDQYIGDVVETKLEDFPDSEKYKKKVRDMRRLTDIVDKISRRDALSIDDLRFMYQIDEKIEGFGYHSDPRIKEVLEKRNAKKDLSLLTGYPESQIATDSDAVEWGGIKVFCGDLHMEDHTIDELMEIMPEIVIGEIRFGHLPYIDERFKLPKVVRGEVVFWDLETFEINALREEYPDLEIITLYEPSLENEDYDDPEIWRFAP